MRVLILGGDGYLGWPTAMAFASKGHDVCVIDNYLRRTMALQTQSEALMPNPDLPSRAQIYKSVSGCDIRVEIGDVTDYRTLSTLFQDFQPETVVHYAEQPSGPYSMIGYREANLTLNNNLNATLNLIFAVMEYAPDCQIIKIGTMGEYGTPNIDIEEGWIEIEHKGRKQKFLFPRAAGTFYHTTKVLDTDMLYYYVRTFNLRVTDLMQGPVYGLSTPETDLDERLLPNFHYDDIFGTLVNRFLVQAVAGVPLTVFGKGGQTRGYLNLIDTLQCIELSMLQPAAPGQLRILNQFVETFSVNDIADKVQRVGNQMGLNVRIEKIKNPRKEAEEHYYNPSHSGLLELGLKPHFMSDEVIEVMLEKILKYKDFIDVEKIMPRVSWV
jgi:UDP-sulfoquinovose synthase